MKTLLKLSIFVSLLILIGISCQKDLSFENDSKPDKEFNASFVRQWYYSSFIKSAEFATFNQKDNGKKQPDWANAKYRKVGNMEILEFPLLKEKKTISVKAEKFLTTADKRRIASASLKRISFIRTSNKEIVIRELDYIPEWEYLKTKNFDISDVQLGNANNKFTGRIVTKKWSGEVLSVRLLSEGKIKGRLISKQKSSVIKKSKSSNPADNNFWECEPVEYCDEQEYCEMEENQGDWQFVVPNNCYWIEFCWTEDECIWVEDDPECNGGPCEPEECNYGSSESCECQLYGIGCSGGGGGGGNSGYNPNIADNIVIDTSISNNYPCLDSLLQALPNSNREAQKTLHDVFGININSQLVFMVDTSLTTTNTNAYTTPGIAALQIIGTDSVYHFIDTIMLSPFMITNSSREYLIGIIMHESIHAYINYRYNQYLTNAISAATFIYEFPIFWNFFTFPLDPTEQQHHSHMALNYVSRIASVVNAFYNPLASTTLRNRVSNSIAWEGLRESTAWNFPGFIDTCRVIRDNVAARNTFVQTNIPATGNCPAATVRYDSLGLSLPCN